jgi:hypothetical protein
MPYDNVKEDIISSVGNFANNDNNNPDTNDVLSLLDKYNKAQSWTVSGSSNQVN